ncbi:hypothetical protein ACFLWZ_03475 [Chloroflexota bacterium]
MPEMKLCTKAPKAKQLAEELQSELVICEKVGCKLKINSQNIATIYTES